MEIFNRKSKKQNKKNNQKKIYFLVIILLTTAIIITSTAATIYIQKNHILKRKYNELSEEISEIENKFNLSNISNDELRRRIDLIKNATITIRNPSYSEVIDFLKEDKTDEINRTLYNYNCTHYARDVNNNAEKKGYRCGYVIVNPDETSSHALVAFNTTDKGIVFFEPQNDRRVNLSIGKDYWIDCIDPPIYGKEELIVNEYIIYW